MSKRVLIVSKTINPVCLETLQHHVETILFNQYNTDEDFISNLKTILTTNKFNGLIWNVKYRLTEEILDNIGPQLRAVSTLSSGIDHIDKKALKERNIFFGRAQIAESTRAVADLAVGILIAAARRFKEGYETVQRGEWKFGINMMLGYDLGEKIVGIVGLGEIGQAVVRRLKGFDVSRFLYAGPSEKPEAKSLGVERVHLDVLLKESDFILLSCPLNPETYHLINENSLKLMKRSAVLVNVARGEIIDHEALYNALKEQQIFAAALDVTTPEPLPREHPLISLPNCFILPHMASSTHSSRLIKATTAAKNILLALEGKPMICSVAL